MTEVDGRLRVEGSTTDEVGHLAHAAGVELHELTPEASDLEKVFLRMTSEVVIERARAGLWRADDKKIGQRHLLSSYTSDLCTQNLTPRPRARWR